MVMSFLFIPVLFFNARGCLPIRKVPKSLIPKAQYKFNKNWQCIKAHHLAFSRRHYRTNTLKN